MEPNLHLLCVTLTLFIQVTAYKHFQERLPNGDHVPHPCKPNVIWQGLGHQNKGGGGPRNPFGLDFDKHGHKWSETLCRLDSDGDGKTNGAELGDPECVWKPGERPAQITGITHPGVCEPLDSPTCKEKNTWDFCSNAEFNCSYIEKPDVQNVTFTLDKAVVPAKETTYMCKTFELPHDQEYHLIATRPVIDNANVMHHMVVFGCESEEGGKDFEDEAKECGMQAGGRCQMPLAIWTLGQDGECHHEKAGFKMGGTKGAKRVVVEYHWNNPEKRANYVDSSGITLYYTPQLRPNDAGLLTVGQVALRIPPGQDQMVTFGAKCTSKCSKNFLLHPLYVFIVNVHMHYLGAAGKLEHYRDGRPLTPLANDEIYSYDSPVFHRYNDNPVQILPGDELRLTCQYKSKYRESVTYYGEGTSDEMCYGLITYYPRQNGPVGMGACLEFNELDTCEAGLDELGGRNGHMEMVAGCNVTRFLSEERENKDDELLTAIVEQCDYYQEGCSVECSAAIANAKNYPCFREDVGLMTQFYLALINPLLGKKYQSIMHTCGILSDGVSGGAFRMSHSALWTILMILYACLSLQLLRLGI